MVKPVLDRNAGRLQQTITNVGEQDPALQATGRTASTVRGHIPLGFPNKLFYCLKPDATLGYSNALVQASVQERLPQRNLLAHAVHPRRPGERSFLPASLDSLLTMMDISEQKEVE